jgi:hypothetical protein
MHEAGRERGIDPLAPTPVIEVTSDKPPAPDFVIPKPDWDTAFQCVKCWRWSKDWRPAG